MLKSPFVMKRNLLLKIEITNNYFSKKRYAKKRKFYRNNILLLIEARIVKGN